MFCKKFFPSLVLFFILTQINGQSTWPTAGWPLTKPAEVGLSADTLIALDAILSSGKYGYIDGLLVIRNGKIAYQKTYSHDYAKIYATEATQPGGLNGSDPSGPYNYFNAWWHPWYHKTNLHTLQSVTKTITSVIIGTAIRNKDFPDINTPVLSFFDTSKISHIDSRKRKMTIKHLLTMTAGFNWNESMHYNDPKNDCSNMEASLDWINFVINKPMMEEPGSRFNYNSGATELLAYIFRVATGKDIEEYAVSKLFTPLGIKNYFWKRSPMGLIDTEGGLYLSAEDLAKIGYLYLHQGEWDGKQLVDKDYTLQSITPAITVGGNTQYGYKWWLGTFGKDATKVYRGSGFGGQFPVVIPDANMIVVFYGWNILQDKPGLRLGEAMRMILNAVQEVK